MKPQQLVPRLWRQRFKQKVLEGLKRRQNDEERQAAKMPQRQTTGAAK